MGEIHVGADESGVWSEERPHPRAFTPWSEIGAVSATRYDCKTHVETVLELQHESGACLEFNSSSPGFELLAAAIGSHYALPANWYAAVEELAENDHVVLWPAAD